VCVCVEGTYIYTCIIHIYIYMCAHRTFFDLLDPCWVFFFEVG
jgi:hypothetical protein